MFNSHDWYWSIEGNDQVYSSARNIYVDPTTDENFKSWSATNGIPHPVKFQDESEIWYYVKEHLPAWMWNGTTMSQPAEGQYTPDQLKAYAETVREATANGGMVADGIPIKTDVFNRTRVTNARVAAEADAQYSTTILGSDGNLYPVNAQQVIAVSDAEITFGTDLADTYATVHGGADDGTITTLQQIDAAFSGVSKTVKNARQNHYRSPKTK
jgi:hypothetical protein